MVGKKVLFLCGSNSCRSQMAEGFLKTLGGKKFSAFSAGAQASVVHPFAVEAMAEVGVDISQQKSKAVDTFRGQRFDCVITVCGDNSKHGCPVFVGEATERLHWDFPDPAVATGNHEEVLAVFRTTRDQIKKKVAEFCNTRLNA